MVEYEEYLRKNRELDDYIVDEDYEDSLKNVVLVLGNIQLGNSPEWNSAYTIKLMESTILL